MISLQTALDYYVLPYDRDPCLAAIIAQIGSAKKSVWMRMYGFTDQDAATALLTASKSGIDVRLLLDHTQESGPSEAQLVHGMIVAGFPADNITITTSELHQIQHTKEIVIDGDAAVPDGQYPTVADATADDYPRVMFGSLNLSPTGFKQDNFWCILPSKLLAADFRTRFNEQWIWARTNEAAYQLKSA